MQDLMERLGLPEGGGRLTDANQAAMALALAMDRVRGELADRDAVRTDARAYAVARLEALRRKLQPLYAAIPRDVESFDLGLVPHERPRLFVDMVAFIELDQDQTGYRLVQDTRGGRVILAEAADDAAIFDHVTVYVARRLVERERSLPERPAPLGAAVRESQGRGAGNDSASAAPVERPPETRDPAAVADARSSGAPMTAEEAFRIWTGASSSMQPAAAPPAAAGMVTDAEQSGRGGRPRETATVRSLVEPVPAEDRPPASDAMAAVMPAQAPAAQPPSAPPPSALPESAAAPETSAPPAAGVSSPAAATVERRWPPASPRQESRGSWVWPLVALLIGAASGAAGLYLYAESLTR